MTSERSTFSILARRCMIHHRNAFAEAAEALVPVNSRNVWLTAIAEMEHSTVLDGGLHCSPVNGKEGRVGNPKEWEYAIGPYRVWVSGLVNRTAGVFGDEFLAEWQFNVRGWYGAWPATGAAFGGVVKTVKNSDLSRLHAWGVAREYSFEGGVTEQLLSGEGSWTRFERWPQI
jgi:hypothetical protein